MSKRNWPHYNRSLVQRGSLTFFCHPSVAKELHKSQSRKGKRGRPPYPSQLILLLMLLKISYGLTYRSCEGMATWLFSGFHINIPCYTTLCRNMRQLIDKLPRLSRRRPKRFLLDSSGWKILGEGEWKVKIHGCSYRRSWVKVHLLIDSKTNEIMDLVVTPSSEADINVALVLMKDISGSNNELLADGAYDGSRLRKQAHEQGIKAIVSPPSNAKRKSEARFENRNDAINMMALLGGDQCGRRLWAKMTGYNHRVKAESAFSRLERLFGSAVYSRDPEAQLVEMWLKAWLSNFWLNLNYA